MTYGFEIDDELHLQLRSPVPPEALAWVERETGKPVLHQVPLEGGTSAALHRLVLDGADEVVVQRFVLDWITEEPWAPTNEALVLDLLAQSSVPSPHLIALDADGEFTGTPMVLMTALPGVLVWDPRELDPWLTKLVDLMMTIHAQPAADTMRAWEPYPPSGVPPAWTKHQAAWNRAIDAYESERPRSDRVFLHRDFHPGNVLWEGGEVSGIVDWVSSCAGPAEEDVAHCRMNLAMHHGQATADRFLQIWLQATGRTEYSPYWDLVDVVSLGGDTPHDRLDEFVAAAAARL